MAVSELLRQDVLTVDEAATVLRISRNSAYEAAKTGEIPTVRVGRTLRVPGHQIRAMLGLSEPE